MTEELLTSLFQQSLEAAEAFDAERLDEIILETHRQCGQPHHYARIAAQIEMESKITSDPATFYCDRLEAVLSPKD